MWGTIPQAWENKHKKDQQVLRSGNCKFEKLRGKEEIAMYKTLRRLKRLF